MKDYIDAINRLEDEMKQLKAQLKTASKATQEFLNKCGNNGITIVSIGKRTKKIPTTETFPFETDGSVFQNEGVRKDGRPAIWKVVEELGIGGGCGNSDQHQVNDMANLCEGVYELKGKTWKKVG